MQEITTRILAPNEKGKSRALWEAVFCEDTVSFLDYYYSEKTKDNDIYALENQQGIVSMLHLNPYLMRIGNERYQTHYIVAVATREEYRKQGMMSKLLKKSLLDMYANKEPFTFLMPASEAIYTPFDFRTAICIEDKNFVPKQAEDIELEVSEATEESWSDIAKFVNDYWKHLSIAIFRDTDYYERWEKELRSEDGRIIVLRKGEDICGVFGYAKGERIEIREPIVLQEKDLLHALFLLFSDENVHCAEMRIMIRVVHLEMFFRTVLPDWDELPKIHIVDPIIEANTATYFRKDGIWEKAKLEVRYEDAMQVSEFMEEICKKFWNKIFINEVV